MLYCAPLSTPLGIKDVRIRYWIIYTCINITIKRQIKKPVSSNCFIPQNCFIIKQNLVPKLLNESLKQLFIYCRHLDSGNQCFICMFTFQPLILRTKLLNYSAHSKLVPNTFVYGFNFHGFKQRV